MKTISIIILLLFTTPACAGDSILGKWVWFQHSTNVNGETSLCTGDIQVKSDKTFHIWNACKRDKNACYIVESADGNWEKIDTNVYRATYGYYFYDVIVKGDIAMFQLMSVSDIYDQGHMEYGVMLKGINIDLLREYYYLRQCSMGVQL